jgi:hypothetical protein
MDGDADLDLFIGGIYSDANKVYANDGDCRFEDVTATSGHSAAVPGASRTASGRLTGNGDIVAGGPPTLPGQAPDRAPRQSSGAPPAATLTAIPPAAVGIAAAARGFGAPQIVSGNRQEADAEHAIEDFDRHLDTAFDATKTAAPMARDESAAVAGKAARFSGDTLDLQSLCDHWGDFTEVVRGSKAMLAHCLSEGKPQSLHDGVLGIGFTAEHAFHLNLMREPRTQRDLETHLADFFGAPLKVSLRDAAQNVGESSVATPDAERSGARLTPEDVAQSRRDAAEDALQQTPRLQEILDAFVGEILEDNQT